MHKTENSAIKRGGNKKKWQVRKQNILLISVHFQHDFITAYNLNGKKLTEVCILCDLFSNSTLKIDKRPFSEIPLFSVILKKASRTQKGKQFYIQI